MEENLSADIVTLIDDEGIEREFEVLDFIERYCRLTEDRRGLSLIEQPDGSCIFLEENPPRCMIQAAKPRQCKTFPLEWNFPGWETKCAGTMIEVKE